MTMLTKSIGGVAALLALALAGCATGGDFALQTTTPTVAVKSAAGVVHGGQQPVSGAAIQLYAVGNTGLGSAATALAAQPSYTDASGQFNFPAGWNCTNTAAYGSNPLIYLVATGGNPGLSGSVNNAALSMMAALGPCSAITTSTYVNVNELTTVAAVYALAPFMADYAHIGSAAANAAGLANAFTMAGALVSTATGAPPGAVASNVSVPVSELDTLANILAVCINTNGTDGTCAGLFTAVTPTGGLLPTEIIGAALQIARNPGNNVTPVFNIALPASPYQPVLMNPPNDWTLALRVTGGGLNAPAGVAIDASGNAWVANAGGNSVTELNNIGAPLTGTNGYAGSNNLLGAQGVAIDRSGNVWVADTLLSSVVKLTLSGGAIQSHSSFTAGGINGPTSLAIDSQNNVWVANFAGGSVTELNSAGTAVGGSPLTAAGTLVHPLGISVDAQGNVWTTDNGAGVVAEFANNQQPLSGTGFVDSGILAPAGIALDSNGRAWVAQSGTNAVGLFAPTGNALLTPPATGGGLNLPTGVAIDGSGRVWVANAASLSQLAYGASAPLSPPTGFGVLNQPAGIAVDGSGNVWTANSGDNSVSVFVGLGTPVVTPLAANVGP